MTGVLSYHEQFLFFSRGDTMYLIMVIFGFKLVAANSSDAVRTIMLYELT